MDCHERYRAVVHPQRIVTWRYERHIPLGPGECWGRSGTPASTGGPSLRTGVRPPGCLQLSIPRRDPGFGDHEPVDGHGGVRCVANWSRWKARPPSVRPELAWLFAQDRYERDHLSWVAAEIVHDGELAFIADTSVLWRLASELQPALVVHP